MGEMRKSLAVLTLCAGLGAGWNAQAFQALEVRHPVQKSNFLHRVRSVDPIMASFLSGRPFFVTVESDFSAEQNGIDRKMAEQQIANKVYDFLAPIVERHSRKPAVFLRPEPKLPADFTSDIGFVNVRVYVHSNVVLSEKTHYQTALNFRIVRMHGIRRLFAGGPYTLISEDDLEVEKKSPYYYQCSSMNDCYNDLLDKNLNDGLQNYFRSYIKDFVIYE